MKKVVGTIIVIVFSLIAILALAACGGEEKITIAFQTNGGEELDDIEISKKDNSLDLPSPEKDGYTFEKWYMDEDFEIRAKLNKIKEMEGEITLYAKWAAKTNTLIFNANGGQGQMADMEIQTGQTVNLNTNQFEKEDYIFDGWAQSPESDVVYEDGADYTMGAESEYTLYAVWARSYTIFFDANSGQGQMDEMSVAEAKQAQLVPNEFIKEGYAFYGWALSPEGEKVYDNENTITMGDEDITLYAKWADVSEMIEIIDENSFYFGEYPQTVANNEELSQMSAQPNSKGYYTSGEDRFVKLIASPKNTLGESGSIFENEQEILTGEQYYFKIEPIKWKILQEDEESYFVVADLILDKGDFGQNNNWVESDMRNWLNDDFLFEAWDEYERLILDTTQNTTYYWEWNGEEQQEQSSQEKVFLLSYDEIIKTEYGFSESQDRVAYVSDYGKALGVWTGAGELTDPPNPEWQIHTGMYYLRSGVLNYRQGRVDSMRYHGGQEGVNPDAEIGIRPALVIRKY
ncbi:MAG: InlB B-repeat-containing protein [Bacillota bacterium]